MRTGPYCGGCNPGDTVLNSLRLTYKKYKMVFIVSLSLVEGDFFMNDSFILNWSGKKINEFTKLQMTLPVKLVTAECHGIQSVFC